MEPRRLADVPAGDASIQGEGTSGVRDHRRGAGVGDDQAIADVGVASGCAAHVCGGGPQSPSVPTARPTGIGDSHEPPDLASPHNARAPVANVDQGDNGGSRVLAHRPRTWDSSASGRGGNGDIGDDGRIADLPPVPDVLDASLPPWQRSSLRGLISVFPLPPNGTLVHDAIAALVAADASVASLRADDGDAAAPTGDRSGGAPADALQAATGRAGERLAFDLLQAEVAAANAAAGAGRAPLVASWLNEVVESGRPYDLCVHVADAAPGIAVSSGASRLEPAVVSRYIEVKATRAPLGSGGPPLRFFLSAAEAAAAVRLGRRYELWLVSGLGDARFTAVRRIERPAAAFNATPSTGLSLVLELSAPASPHCPPPAAGPSAAPTSDGSNDTDGDDTDDRPARVSHARRSGTRSRSLILPSADGGDPSSAVSVRRGAAIPASSYAGAPADLAAALPPQVGPPRWLASQRPPTPPSGPTATAAEAPGVRTAERSDEQQTRVPAADADMPLVGTDGGSGDDFGRRGASPTTRDVEPQGSPHLAPYGWRTVGSADAVLNTSSPATAPVATSRPPPAPTSFAAAVVAVLTAAGRPLLLAELRPRLVADGAAAAALPQSGVALRVAAAAVAGVLVTRAQHDYVLGLVAVPTPRVAATPSVGLGSAALPPPEPRPRTAPAAALPCVPTPAELPHQQSAAVRVPAIATTAMHPVAFASAVVTVLAAAGRPLRFAELRPRLVAAGAATAALPQTAPGLRAAVSAIAGVSVTRAEHDFVLELVTAPSPRPVTGTPHTGVDDRQRSAALTASPATMRPREAIIEAVAGAGGGASPVPVPHRAQARGRDAFSAAVHAVLAGGPHIGGLLRHRLNEAGAGNSIPPGAFLGALRGVRGVRITLRGGSDFVAELE